MEKVRKKSKRGGARPGSGRPQGVRKIKISVSVDRGNFTAALNKSGQKPSRLIDFLLDQYTANVHLEDSRQ